MSSVIGELCNKMVKVMHMFSFYGYCVGLLFSFNVFAVQLIYPSTSGLLL